MDNVFKDAMRQVFNPAPPELVAGFRRKMGFIQEQYKHNRTTVQSCLDGMAEHPSLLELLTASYVVNGGLLFKYDGEEEADDDYTRLMREMEELNCESDTVTTRGSAPSGGTRTLARAGDCRSSPLGPALARSPTDASGGLTVTSPSPAPPAEALTAAWTSVTDAPAP